MGQMRFFAPRPECLSKDAVQRAYLCGMEIVPWLSRRYREGNELVVERDVDESGSLHIPLADRGPRRTDAVDRQPGGARAPLSAVRRVGPRHVEPVAEPVGGLAIDGVGSAGLTPRHASRSHRPPLFAPPLRSTSPRRPRSTPSKRCAWPSTPSTNWARSTHSRCSPCGTLSRRSCRRCWSERSPRPAHAAAGKSVSGRLQCRRGARRVEPARIEHGQVRLGGTRPPDPMVPRAKNSRVERPAGAARRIAPARLAVSLGGRFRHAAELHPSVHYRRGAALRRQGARLAMRGGDQCRRCADAYRRAETAAHRGGARRGPPQPIPRRP